MKTTMKTMSGWTVGFALAIALMVSPGTFGQVTIDGKEVAEDGKTYTQGAKSPVIVEVHVKGQQTRLDNNGLINTANITEGVYVGNKGSTADTVNAFGVVSTQVVNYGGKIGTLNLSDEARLVNYGKITEMNMYGGGAQNNNHTYSGGAGNIGTANIYDGHFINQSHIDTANISGGTVACTSDGTKSTITTANVTGGHLSNGRGSSIGTVNISAGWLTNQQFDFDKALSVIGEVNVSGNGKVANGKDSIIETMHLDGGTVGNFGKIDALTYTEGTYNAKQYVNNGGQTIYAKGSPGRIGTLTAAGTLQAHDDWGIVENLQFHNDGSGFVNIAGYVTAGDIGFSGVKADNVDFAFGNIWLDLTNAITFDTDWISSFVDMNLVNDISFATLFNADEVTNAWDLNSFYVNWDGYMNFGILDNGKFADGWGFNSDYTWFVYSDNSTATSATPEPATLVMLGLGLAGLPIARCLRKKRVK